MPIIAGFFWGESVDFVMNLWKYAGKAYRDDEDELTAESVWGKIWRGMVYDCAGLIPGGEELSQLLGAIFLDDRWYDLEVMGITQVNDILGEIGEKAKFVMVFIEGLNNVRENGGDIWQYISENHGTLLGAAKEFAKVIATACGLPVNNIEAYLIGPFRSLCPEIAERYEALFDDSRKNDLSGLSGNALEFRVGDLLESRNITTDDTTISALAGLYQAGYNGAVPSDIPSSISVDGEDRKLGEYQKQTYGNIWSSIVADGLDELVAADGFADAEPDVQEKMLKALYDYAAEVAKAELFDDYEPSSRVQTQKEYAAAGLSLAEYAQACGMFGTDARIDELVMAGLKVDEAFDVSEDLEDLEPLPGEDDVSNLQKWRVCVEFSPDVDDQIAALSIIMTDSQLEKVEKASENGVEPESYISYLECRMEYDTDENGKLTQTEVTAAIDSLQGLSNAQKAVLWQVSNKQWKAGNNPYDPVVGQRIVDAWD